MADITFFKEMGIAESNDPVISEIRSDMGGKSSPLELLGSYLSEAKGSAANDPPAFLKLAKLFARGVAPKKVEGHFFGVTMGLRTGKRKGLLRRYGNILNLLWGKLMADAPPWVGKGFTAIDDKIKSEYLKGNINAGPHFLGINYFRKNNVSFFNKMSIAILDRLFKLKYTGKEEQNRYGYDKTGGAFIGRFAKSVNPGAEAQDVFQINYRFSSLESPFPLKYLIDEIVEVAPGLHLGQLLFATERLLKPYDPSLPDREYGYEHFGYFLIMDERWNEERRKIFPYTEEIWRTKASSIEWTNPKFRDFTFDDKTDGRVSDAVLKEVLYDKNGKETVLDLIKFYSDQLAKDPNTHSHYFDKLGEIFNRAVGPKEVKGYYHGAVVAFRNEGLLKTSNLNTLNMLWPFVRHLSPWTGKTFEDIAPDRLKEITDGWEKGEIPTRWGTNTYADRTAVQKVDIAAMRFAKVRLDDASADESRMGYDVKSFFFIAHQNKTVNAENNNKTVFQFNYRWPKLKTFPPDHYCIDELVQIADGLYMGQLIYATALHEKYDPNKPSSAYDYRNFGYFLLMDDEWYARKIQIGFDITPWEK